MNKIALAVIATALLVAAGLYKADANNTNMIPPHVHTAFAAWQNEHGKNYASPSEKNFRLGVFYKNYLTITATNLVAKGYRMGLNQFSDLTKEEFLTKNTGLRFKTEARNEKVLPNVNDDNVDWRAKGAVNPIKNQGQCGSCWAFSATGATESAWFIKTGKLLDLAEQALVDCSGSYGNYGCNGGWMDYAFKYNQDKGTALTADYPYTAVTGTCKSYTSQFNGTGYFDVPVNDGQQLTNAVTATPTSVAIDAYGIMSYTSGIFNGPCGTSLNHGVIAVGYGVDNSNGTLYWIVRNSWGTSWGEQGYFRMVRSLDKGAGMCGIQMASSYPTV